MDYKTTPIEFTISDRKGTIAPLKLIMKDVKREIILKDTMTLSFSTLNHEENKIGYDLIINENVVIHDEHVYIIKQVSDYGSYKKVNCVHEFSNLSKTQRYDYLDGQLKASEVLEFLFDGTGWNLVYEDPTIADVELFIAPEKFGQASVLKLFKDFLNRTNLEFRIQKNKTLLIKFGTTTDGIFDFSYGVNIKDLALNTDSTQFYTRIRGYYSNVIGVDEDGKNIEEWDYVEAINPEAEAKFGILEMDTIWDSNIKSSGRMEAELYRRLYSMYNYTVDLTSVDYQPKEIGQYVQINHPNIDFSWNNLNLRILKITEGLIHNELNPVDAEIGNYFIDYVQDTLEDRVEVLEKEVRDLKKISNFLFVSKFNVGTKNALAVPSVIMPINAELPSGISGVISYKNTQEFNGIFITKKTSYDKYYVEVKTYNSDGVLTGTYDLDTERIFLESVKLPNEDMHYVSVSVASSKESTVLQLFGVKFEKNTVSVDDVRLSEFSIDTIDCLQLAGVEMGYGATSLSAVQATINYEEMSIYSGLSVVPQNKTHYVEVTTFDKDGNSSTASLESLGSSINSWDFPTDRRMVVIITVQEEIPSKFDSTIHRRRSYGVKFINSGEEKSSGYYIESETVMSTSGGAEFNFTTPYDEVVSVTLGLGVTEQDDPVNAQYELIKTDDKYTGVFAYVKGLVSGNINVSMQAVCREGAETNG